MKTRRRLTRQESKQATRARLIDAAERLFVRKGFDDASVQEISEAAGYSRGAFYSNFDDKEQVFLAVLDRRRPQVPEALRDKAMDVGARVAAVREWFSNQWRLKDFISLRIEFSRRAMRDRSVRKRLAELRRQEVETYAASVARYIHSTQGLAADRPELVSVVLLAVTQGRGSLAIDSDPEWEQMYTEAAAMAFDRMIAPQIFQLG